MMYTEWPLLERFVAASDDGFDGVEIQFPYVASARALSHALLDSGLEQTLINTPAGDPDMLERGFAALPGRQSEFRDGLLRAMEYASAMRCRRIHVMAGATSDWLDPAEVRDTYVENLAWAAAQCRPANMEVLIEPINSRDMPGYLLSRQSDAHEIVQRVGADNLRVQMDLYRCQISEGDLGTKLEHYLPSGRVGYMQIAGVPDRHEPDRGELNAAYLFQLIDRHGYDGWMGCEYRPAGATRDGLGWLALARG